jgi:hypothetical protein
MRKLFATLSINSLLLMHILAQGSAPPSVSSTEFKNKIVELLKPYQVPMPEQAATVTKTFDEWVAKITKSTRPSWKNLAEELLKRIQDTKDQIVINNRKEQTTFDDYAQYRFTILKDQMDVLFKQRKQEFLALNQAFNLTSAALLKLPPEEKALYQQIVTTLTPPDANYIETHKYTLFKQHMQTYILTTLNLKPLINQPEAGIAKIINTLPATTVIKAIEHATSTLATIQTSMALLNKRRSSGLKQELKNKKLTIEAASAWWITRKLGLASQPQSLEYQKATKELNLLREELHQLEMTCDYYLFIISKLFAHPFTPQEITTLNTQKQQFELLKKQRAQSQSWFSHFWLTKQLTN